MKKKTNISIGALLLAGVVGITLVLVACGGGSSSAAGRSPSASPAATGVAERFRRNGNIVGGTVKSVNGDTITVATNSGDAQFQVTGSTTVEKSVAATAFDLVEGKFVTVRGQRNADGSITASSVQIGQPPQENPNATPRPSFSPRARRSPGAGGFGANFGFSGGTIQSVGNGTITIKTQRGTQITVQLPDSAVITATVSGTMADIATGQTVLARGQKNAAGVLVADTVQVGVSLGNFQGSFPGQPGQPGQ